MIRPWNVRAAGWWASVLLVLGGTGCVHEGPAATAVCIRSDELPSWYWGATVGTVFEGEPLREIERRPGVCLAYFESGSVAYRAEVNRFGALDGRLLTYYPEGPLKQEIKYARGVQSGICRVWDREGNLVHASFWLAGVPIPDSPSRGGPNHF